MAETPGYVSNAKLAERISALVDRWNTRENQMIALLTQSEGIVTVTDGLGKDHALPSFLQLSEDVSELVDELTGAVTGASEFANAARLHAEGAQASANDAQTSAEDAAERLADASARAEAAAVSATASAASAFASESSNQASVLHENAASASAADADADAIQAANSKSQAFASANAAASSEGQAASYAHQAEDWSDKAGMWANAPAGTELEPGAFSAKHWSEQAKASLTGTLVYRGSWDASTGSFPETGNTGAFYKVTVGGTTGGRQFNPGDQIVHNGSGWDHIDNTEQVTSVAGKSGAVQLVAGDIGGLGALATRDDVDFNTHVKNKPASYPASSHTHTKGDVGLSNVDNTRDADKPVSTAAKQALDAKFNNSGGGIAGQVSVNAASALVAFGALGEVSGKEQSFIGGWANTGLWRVWDSSAHGAFKELTIHYSGGLNWGGYTALNGAQIGADAFAALHVSGGIRTSGSAATLQLGSRDRTDSWHLYNAGGSLNFWSSESQRTAATLRNNGDFIVSSALFPGGAGSAYLYRRAPDELAVNQRFNVGGDHSVSGEFYCNNWIRSNASGTGWYNQVHGGGIYMQDNSWVRVYNNKGFLVNANIRMESSAPTIEVYDTDNGNSSWIHFNDGNHGFLAHNQYAWCAYRNSGNEWHCTNNIVAYSSDRRLKQGIVDVSSVAVADFFDRFRVREFDWNHEAIAALNPTFSPRTDHEIGGIAQEAEEVYPLMVATHDHNSIKTIMWEKAVPLLIAEVQALRTRVNTLESMS